MKPPCFSSRYSAALPNPTRRPVSSSDMIDRASVALILITALGLLLVLGFRAELKYQAYFTTDRKNAEPVSRPKRHKRNYPFEWGCWAHLVTGCCVSMTWCGLARPERPSELERGAVAGLSRIVELRGSQPLYRNRSIAGGPETAGASSYANSSGNACARASTRSPGSRRSDGGA